MEDDDDIANWHIVTENWEGDQALFEVDCRLPYGCPNDVLRWNRTTWEEHIDRIRHLINQANEMRRSAEEADND